jgi:hypothetical protein
MKTGEGKINMKNHKFICKLKMYIIVAAAAGGKTVEIVHKPSPNRETTNQLH